MGKGGYGLTYQEVYEMENLTIEAKAIYGMLCSYAGSKATAYPSVDFICNKLKISRTRFYLEVGLLNLQTEQIPDIRMLMESEILQWNI